METEAHLRPHAYHTNQRSAFPTPGPQWKSRAVEIKVDFDFQSLGLFLAFQTGGQDKSSGHSADFNNTKTMTREDTFSLLESLYYRQSMNSPPKTVDLSLIVHFSSIGPDADSETAAWPLSSGIFLAV